MDLNATLKKEIRQFKEMSSALIDMELMLTDFCGSAGELSDGLGRINSSGGKRFRPMLAWICWKIAGKKGPIVPLMCMLELMHTASLIHDDIVDGALLRRGVATINEQAGIQEAIRSGDYLLARAMELLKTYRGTGINEALSRVSELMSIGELRQQLKAFDADGLTEDEYREYVFGKTAAFIAESCRSGAVAGGASSQESRSIWEYGMHLGIAFQMRDDYLDWVEDAGTGKAPLQDLRSGVMTLPVILAANQDGGPLKELLIKKIKTEQEIKSILQMVRNAGALEIAREYLSSECLLAVSALDNTPGSTEKSALTQLAKSISEVK
jgi:geranylgeranyl pyrophosphate synthase